jgi:hypothetical protein
LPARNPDEACGVRWGTGLEVVGRERKGHCGRGRVARYERKRRRGWERELMNAESLSGSIYISSRGL